MFILKYKKIFLSLSAVLVIASIISLAVFNLKLGIEYTGGAIIDFTTTENITEVQLKERLEEKLTQNFTLRTTESGFSLRLKDIGEDSSHNLHVLNAISNDNIDNIAVQKFDTIGPTLGNELKSKAGLAILLALVSITLFIAYAFRHVSKPVSSWRYGFITIIALAHDIIITLGVFALLGYTMGIEIDSLFLTAILVILGYSINDTIVVFDRIRENLIKTEENKREKEFDQVVGKSLNQTFVRSFNTSFTTLLTLVIIFVITPSSIHNFALALIVGIASGTYSSLFVAAPLLTYAKPKVEKKG
jgi:preprotein translocase subunit SecF